MLTKQFIAGAIGQAGLAVSGILALAIEYSYLLFESFIFLNIVYTDILIVSFVLILASTARLSQTSESRSVGTVAVAFGIITGLINLIIYIEGWLGRNWVWGYTFTVSSEILYYPNQTGLILILATELTFGIALGFLGGFFMTYRKSFSPALLWAATGIVYLAAAALQISFLFTDPAYILSIVAGIMGAVSLLLSKHRESKR
jgi:hypothetical protein